MLRRIFYFLFILLFLASCDTSSSKSTIATTSSKSSLQVIDTLIDFTKVDVYPIFSDCENFSENDNQKKCFERMLTQKLASLLQKSELKVKERVNDTTLIDILIDQSGKASVVNIKSPESIVNQLPKLEFIIRQSIAELPSIKPAVKRGVLVSSQYRLAIIVRTL